MHPLSHFPSLPPSLEVTTILKLVFITFYKCLNFYYVSIHAQIIHNTLCRSRTLYEWHHTVDIVMQLAFFAQLF